MKGLAWYSIIIYALYILKCLGLAVSRWLPPNPQPQGLVVSLAPLVYAALTVISLVIISGFIRSLKYGGRGKAVFCLVWEAVVALLPVIVAITGSSHSTAALFTLLSAGYEWTFIALACLFMLLFIPVVIFWIVYLARLGRAAGSAAA